MAFKIFTYKGNLFFLISLAAKKYDNLPELEEFECKELLYLVDTE